MNETKVGQSYFSIIGSIKDQTSSNLVEVCRELNMNDEAIRKLLFTVESTIETSGGNAFPALLKSCK